MLKESYLASIATSIYEGLGVREIRPNAPGTEAEAATEEGQDLYSFSS